MIRSRIKVTSSARSKLHSVQYLRGIAALSVVVAHGSSHPLPHASYNSALTGHAGVLLFFVISGFIMIAITGDRFVPGTFLKHRIIRIVPLYWLVTIATAFIALAVPLAFKDTVFSARHLITSLLFIPARNPGAMPSIAPVIKLGWTLNFEMFFYAVFATLFWLRIGARAAVMSVIFLGLVLLGELFHPTNVLGEFYCSWELLAFVAGTWIGVAYLRAQLDRIRTPVAALLALNVLAAVAAYYLSYRGQDSLSEMHTLLFIDASASIILLGLWLELRNVLPNWRILHFFGDASYSMYLAHMFGVGAAAAVAHKLWGPNLAAGQATAAITLCIVCGVVAGAVTYWCAERPLLNLLRPGKALPIDVDRSTATRRA